MKIRPIVIFVAAQLAAASVFADVELNTQELRSYQLPGTFELSGAQVQLGANNSTILTNTMGASPANSVCGVIIASADGAELVEYQYDGKPTICFATLPHPDGGVFIRGVDPTAEVGAVTGFTAYLDQSGTEVWAVPDQRLVDAQPEPNGTGTFQGMYQQPDRALAYSPNSDKLLGFSIGLLDLGIDQKFITQAHVINVESGGVTVSGQTFGQSGVGLVGGSVVRPSDGHYLIYYFSNGSQGAFFYDYDGRSSISFFNPRGEDWDDRFVIRMVYERDLLHLLWTETEDLMAQTRLTTATDSGAELFTETFDPMYQFADGQEFALGPPATMWVGKENTAILYVVDQDLFLRVVDINGASGGMARLNEAAPQPAAGILVTEDGGFRLLTYDSESRRLFEYDVTFEDVDDFDPNKPPGDVSIPDVGISDVLEAAGCCRTTQAKTPGVWWLLILGVLVWRRRERC